MSTRSSGAPINQPTPRQPQEKANFVIDHIVNQLSVIWSVLWPGIRNINGNNCADSGAKKRVRLTQFLSAVI